MKSNHIPAQLRRPSYEREDRKKLAKVWHPDRYGHDPELQKDAGEKMQKINQAWDTIKKARGIQ